MYRDQTLAQRIYNSVLHGEHNWKNVEQDFGFFIFPTRTASKTREEIKQKTSLKFDQKVKANSMKFNKNIALIIKTIIWKV